MTNEQLGTLLEAFADYYWSVPVAFVAEKVRAWHPEVSEQQFAGVLKKSKTSFWHHFYVMKEGLEEPEIVTEHLLAVDDKDFDQFIATRIDGPYCECDEATLLRLMDGVTHLDIPEAQAIKDFGRKELNLNDEWIKQLLDDCVLIQPYSLCNGESWVEGILRMESYGKIRFQTVEQVARFRDLGNRLYQALPNPVLKGWKPCELENPPLLSDDIPEKDEDIPDSRAKMEKIFEQFGGLEKVKEDFEAEFSPIKKKVGRNDPCPCGSGKKYKKCCGAKAETTSAASNSGAEQDRD